MTFEIFLIEWWNKKKIVKDFKNQEKKWVILGCRGKKYIKECRIWTEKKEANIFPLQPKMIYFSLCMKSLIILITKNKDTPNSRYIKSQGTNLILSFIAIFTPLSP